MFWWSAPPRWCANPQFRERAQGGVCYGLINRGGFGLRWASNTASATSRSRRASVAAKWDAANSAEGGRHSGPDLRATSRGRAPGSRHSRLTGATRMPRHRWWALYAPEDPPILAAVSSRSWGWSGRPRFHGDDQSRLGSSWLVPAAKAKAALAREQLFLPRRAGYVAAGPALDNDHPSSAFLTSESKRLPHRRAGGSP
jgi:hypothetical protein